MDSKSTSRRGGIAHPQIQEHLGLALDNVLAVLVRVGHLPDDVPDATLDTAFSNDRRVRRARRALTRTLAACMAVPRGEEAHRAALEVEEAANALASAAVRVGWRVGLRVGRAGR